MELRCSRRSLLGAASLVGASTIMQKSAAGAGKSPFSYALNTSTVRGQNLTLAEEIAVAGRAGYEGIEPWIREIESYRAAGGSLADLRKQLSDEGLRVVSAIGFSDWIVDDETRRKKALEQMRREMEMVAAIGGATIAAPPAGATEVEINLDAAAERYRALLDLGREQGVIPQLEVWGFSNTMRRLPQALYVASAAAHPDACILADVYHLHRGGSGFEALRLIDGAAMHAFHVNDYPAQPAAPELTDADRVYPGDGAAPLRQILRTLAASGFSGALSIELFNKEYWAQPADQVAATALSRLRRAVASALE